MYLEAKGKTGVGRVQTCSTLSIHLRPPQKEDCLLAGHWERDILVLLQPQDGGVFGALWASGQPQAGATLYALHVAGRYGARTEQKRDAPACHVIPYLLRGVPVVRAN